MAKNALDSGMEVPENSVATENGKEATDIEAQVAVFTDAMNAIEDGRFVGIRGTIPAHSRVRLTFFMNRTGMSQNEVFELMISTLEVMDADVLGHYLRMMYEARIQDIIASIPKIDNA